MQSKIGEIYEGKVTGLTSFGAFIKLSNGDSGMVHISEVASVYVKNISDHLSEGQEVKVKVLAVNDNKISLSIKQAQPKTENAKEKKPEKKPDNRSRGGFEGNRRPAPADFNQNKSGDLSFEEMMAKFKQVSDEKMSDLKRSSDTPGRPRRSNGH